MSTGHEDPTYKDAVAVVAGLDRLSNDLTELAAEAATVAKDLRRVLSEIPAARLEALDAVRLQLSWLAGDAERMRAALARGEEDHDS